MKKYIITLIILAFASAVYAQSTATQIQLGFLTTSSCPGGASVCWKPYSVSNPMPVISN